MDIEVIPKGFYCYGIRVKNKFHSISFEKANVSFFEYYDKVMCPYWKDIGNGLIECKYLKTYTLNLEDINCRKKALKFFSGDKAKLKEFSGYLFWDKVKDCNIDTELTFDKDGNSIDFELISDKKLQKINLLIY